MTWKFWVDGQEKEFKQWANYPKDSLQIVQRRVISGFQQQGFYFAKVKEIQIDSVHQKLNLYIEKGTQTTWHEIRVIGNNVTFNQAFRSQMKSQEGISFNKEILEQDIQEILRILEAKGFLLAKVRIEKLAFIENKGWSLILNVDTEQPTKLGGFLFESERMKPALLEKILQVKKEKALQNVSLEAWRQQLEASQLFENVESVGIKIDRNSAAQVVIKATELQVGSFDLALGYLPATSPNTKGGLIGNGSLAMRNVAGKGELFHLKLHKLSAQVSQFETALQIPYIAGLPLKVGMKFHGYQRDSTYHQLQYEAELGYKIGRRFEISGTAKRFNTRPSGNEHSKEIVRAETNFFGFGMEYNALDQLYNPRKGWFIRTQIEQGNKAQAVSESANEKRQRSRFTTHFRCYVPTFKRQVLVWGNDTQWIRGNALDESELFRFGGATSFRGYNEEQFRAALVSRLLLEYRYQLDKTAFFYAFSDVGYVAPLVSEMAATSPTRIGFGLGLQYNTPLGLMNMSYALNSEEGLSKGRIHLGLSLGL